MEIKGYRLHKRPDKTFPTKTEKITLNLYFSENDNKILLDKYNFDEFPLTENVNGKYYELFIQATINTFDWGGDEEIDEFEQYIFFDFIHMGTDFSGENPSFVIEDEELKSKLYFDFNSFSGGNITIDNYSDCIIKNSNSSSNLLDFLKITVADKMT